MAIWLDRRGMPRNKMTARNEFKPTRDDYVAISARTGVLHRRWRHRGNQVVDERSRRRGQEVPDLGAFGRLRGLRIDRLDEAPERIGYADFEGRPIRVVPIDIWKGLGLSTEDVSVGPARPTAAPVVDGGRALRALPAIARDRSTSAAPDRDVKTYLLWDRFLSCWLPPDDVTGDIRHDIDDALRKTYTCEGGAGTFALKGGRSGIVITQTVTRVASKIPPHRTPDWLEWLGALPGEDVTAFLHEAVRDFIATPRPHVIIKTGRSPLALDEIVLGNGTVVVVNEPGKATATDSVRVHRAPACPGGAGIRQSSERCPAAARRSGARRWATPATSTGRFAP